MNNSKPKMIILADIGSLKITCNGFKQIVKNLESRFDIATCKFYSYVAKRNRDYNEYISANGFATSLPSDSRRRNKLDSRQVIDAADIAALGNIDAVGFITGEGDILPVLDLLKSKGIEVYDINVQPGKYEYAYNDEIPAFTVEAEATDTSARIQSLKSMMVDFSSLPATGKFTKTYAIRNTSLDSSTYGSYLTNVAAGTYKISLTSTTDAMVTLISDNGAEYKDLITSSDITEARFEVEDGVNYMLVFHSATTGGTSGTSIEFTVEEVEEYAIAPGEVLDIGTIYGGAAVGGVPTGDTLTVNVAADTPAGTYKIKLIGQNALITQANFEFIINGVTYVANLDMTGGPGKSVTVEVKGGDVITIISRNISDYNAVKLSMTAV